MTHRLIVLVVAAVLGLSIVAAAGAVPGTTSTDGTTTVLTSPSTGPFWNLDSQGVATYGSIDWAPQSTLTVSQLSGLAADMEMTVGDCGGGSPRFSIELADGKSLFVYIGQQPGYDNCGLSRFATGNLLAAGQTRVDATQEGGPYNDSWSDVQTNFGGKQITDISYVLDGGWSQAGQEQQVNVYSLTLSFTSGADQTLAAPSPVSTVQVDHVGACASGAAYRVADGSYGAFVDIAESQFNTGKYTDAKGSTWDVWASNYAAGMGFTCDNPANYGYHYAGYKVSSDGMINQQAPQFNIYPYWVR